MFGLYFGYYLVEKNKISQSQFEDLLHRLYKSRTKLGFLAVTEKLLTTKQAEEINELQKQTDRLFGVIAIDKGYLLDEEVTYLLNLQVNSYLKFVQLLTEDKIMSMAEIVQSLEDYKNDHSLSDNDIDALKSDDIERIISVFINNNIPLLDECVNLIIRNMIRFIDNKIIIQKPYRAKQLTASFLVSQKLSGASDLFLGISGNEAALISFAASFAKKTLLKPDATVFDYIAEFICCCNRLYTKKLKYEQIHMDMMSPVHAEQVILTSEENMYIVPILIGGKQMELIASINTPIETK